MIYSDQIPGKRFVFMRESAKKNIEVLESGYIRCCNVPFVKDNLGSIKLLLQYDGSNSFDVVNLTKVKSKILIEHILVEVSKDVQRIPALVFVSPFPKDNADTIYVQYFGSTEIKKVSKKKISPFRFKKEMRVTNSDNADLHDFADWLRIQKTKILLLLGPYELQSCRIDIYCLKSKCKKSGTLLSSDMLNKKVRFQDQQCDIFEVDSSLAQIKFNCSDEQLEQFMTGFAPKRSSRSTKKVNISKNPFIWNLPSWLSEQRYNNEYTSFFKHKNKSNVTSYKTTKSSETLINASSQSSLVSRKDCTDKVDKTTLKSTLNSLSLNSSSKSSLVSEKYSTDKAEKSISKSTLNSLSLSASSQSSLVSGKDSANKVVDSMSKSALSSSSLNTSSKSSLVSGNDSTDKVDKTISKSLLNSLSLNVSSQSSLVSRKDCTDKVEKSISKSTLNSSSLNTSSKSSLVSRKYCTDKVDKTTLKSTLNSLSLNVSSQSSLVLGKDSTDKGVNKSTVVETTPTSSVVSENNKTDIFTEPISKSIVVSNKDDTDNFMNKSVTNLNKDKQRPFSSDSGKKRLSITKYLVIKDMRQYITVDDDNQFFVGVEFDEISKQRIFSLESENKESNSIMQMNSFQVSTTSTHKKLNKSFQHRRISYQPFEVSEKCPYWKMPKGNFKLRRSASDGNMSISIACHSEENWQQKNHLEASNLKGANNHSKGYNLEGINSQTVYNQTRKRKYLSQQQDIINVTTPNIYHELSLTHQSSTNNIQLLKDDTENTRLNQLSRQKNQKSDFNTAHIDFSRNKSLIKSVVTKSSQTEIPFEEITSNRTTTETQTDQQIGVSKCICDKVTRKTVAVETQTDEQMSFNRDPQSIISNKASNIKLSGSGKLESNEEKQMNLMLRLTDAIKNRYIENVDKFCEDIKTFFKTTIDKKDCSCTSVATVSNIQTTLPNNDREGMTQSNSVTTENQFVSKTGDSMGNINTTVVPHHLSDSIIPSKSNSEDQVKRLTPDICQTAAIGKSKIMELQQYNESNKRNIVQEQINLNFSNYENMPSIFPKKESQIAPAKSFSKRLSTSHEKLNRIIDPQKNLQQSTFHEKQIFTIPTQNVLKQSKSVISTQATPVSTQAVFNLNQHISQLKSPATLDSINKITSTQSFPSNQISQYDNNIQKSNKYWQNQQQQDYERVRAEDQNKLVVQNKINTTKVSKGTIMASKESISSNGINSVISSNSDVITMMECSRSPIILSSTESGNKKPEKKPRKSKSRSQSNLSDKTPKKKKSTQNVARRHNSSSILEGSNRIYDNNFLHQNVDPYYGFLPFPNLLADKLSNNDLYNMSSSANEYPFASPRSHGKSASNIATSTNEKYPNLHTLQTNSNLNLLKDSLPLLSSIDMYSFSASQTHQPDIPLYPTLDLPGDCNKSFVRSYLGEDPVTSLDFDNILPFENSRNSTVETRDQKISKNKLNSRIRPYNHILESQLQVSEPSEMLSPTGLCHPSLRMKNQSKVAKHQLKEAFSDSRSTSAIDKLNDFSLTGNMEKIPLAAKSSNKTPYTYHFPTVPPDLPVKSTSNLAVSSTITKILPPERMLHTLNSTVISSTKPIMHSAIISSSPFIKPAAKETHYSSPSANHTVVSLGNLTAKLPTKTIVDSTHTIQSMSAGHHQHSLCAPTKTRLSHPSGSFCFDSHPSTAEETLTKSVTVPASTSSNVTISVSNLINRILRTDVSSASSPSTFNVNSIKQISNSITNSYYSQVQPVSSMSSLCTTSSITDILPSSHKILLSKKEPVIMSSANTTNSLIQQPNQSINQSHIPIASCELKGDIDFEVKYSDSSSQIQLPSSSAETAGVRVVFPNVLTSDSILDTSKPIIQTNNILKPKSNKTIIKTKTKICRRGKFRKTIVIRDSISKYLKPNGIRKTIYVTDMDICLRKISSDRAEKVVKLIEDRYTFSSSDLNPPGKNLLNQESDKTFKGEERNTPKKLNENLSLITTNPEYNNLNSESEKHLACTTKTNVFSSISPSQISSMSTISCMELRSQNTLASPKEEKEKYIPATTVMTSHGQNLTKKLSFVPSSQHQNLFSENTFQKSPHSHYKPSTEYSQVNNAKPQSESIIYPRSPEFAYVSSQMQATTSQALTTPVSLRDIYNNRDICLNNTAPKDILASENIGVKELSRINDIFSYKNKTEVIRNHHQNVGHFINPNKTFSKGQNLQNTSRSENTFLNVTSALNLSTASITSHSILSSNHSQVRLNDHQRLEYPLPSVKSPVLSNRNLLTPLKNNEADISSHNTQVKLTKSVTYKPIKLSQSLPIATLVHIPSTNRRVSLSSHKIQPLTENQTKLLTLLNISTSTMEVIKKENNFKAAPYELQLKETENTNKAGTFSELQHKRFSTSILSPLSANTKSIHVSTMTKPTASVAVRPEQNKGFAGSILSPSSANTKSIQVLTMTKPTASVAVRPEQNKGFAGSILSLLPANTKSIQVLTMTKPTASIEVKPEQHKGFAGSILSPSSANTKSIQVLTMTKPTASVEVRPEQDKGLAASILTPSSAKTKSIHVSTMTKPNASVAVNVERLTTIVLKPNSKENFKYDQLKKFLAAPNNLSMLANQADLRRECSTSSNSGSIFLTIPSHMITVPSSRLYNTEQKPSNVQRIHTSASSNVIMNASIKNAYSTKNKSSTHNHIDLKKVSVISKSKLLPSVPNSSFKDPESTITSMNTERKISSPNLIENGIKISPGLFDSIFPSSTIKNEVNQHIYHPAVKRKLDTPSQSPNYFNHAKESPQTFKPIKGTEPPSSKYPKLSSVITHTTKNLSILLDPVPNQRFQNLTNSRPFQRLSTSNVTPIITTPSFTPLNRISPLKVMVSDCFKPTTKTSQKLSETEKTTSIGITKKKKKNKKRRCWFPDKGEVDLGRVFGMFGSSSTSENMKKNNQKNKQQVEPLGQYKPAETVKLKKRKVCMTTGKHYLQSVACTDLQHLPMCIDCRDGGGNDDGSYCRFTMFRRLIQQEGGSPQVAGFCLPHEADDHDIEHWTYQHHEPTLDIESCIYIMQHIGMQFYQLVLQEVEAQSFRVSHDSSDVKWKRPVLQVREMCDICATTIFNIHWTCEQCGLGVCLDCFKSVCNEKNSSKALDWPECDDDVDHDPVDLMVTQTIPKNVLADLLREMLMVCQKIDLKFFKLDILHSDKEKERASLKLLQDWNGLIAKQTGKPLHTEDHVDADRNIFESYNDLEFPSLPERCSWYCDSTMLHFNNPELNEDESKWFQSEWNKGKPIVVSNCHEKLDRSLWTPKAFGDDFGQEKNDIVNCYDGTLIEKFPVWQFWKGFESIEDRPVFTDQPTALLKLKDWPPGDDFKDKMPNRFADIMNGLPAPRYTKRTGVLNLASRLPAFFAVPDLGPKMYNAYGSASYPKSGTTNLHLDISDATNLMVYVGIPNDSEIGPNEVRDTFKIVDRACCSETQARIRKPGVLPGALWHIFPAHSAEKIRRFLRTVALERNITIKADSDPIHDQAYYLDQVLLDRLYREEGVKGYAICQCLGDAVFIPAGAPHQVLNLHSCIKVAEDFVAPEHIGHCFQLTQEFRRLSNYHTNHEDKLQIKNIIYHSVKDCLGVIKNHYGL